MGAISESGAIREGLKIGNGLVEMSCWNQAHNFKLETLMQMLFCEAPEELFILIKDDLCFCLQLRCLCRCALGKLSSFFSISFYYFD